MNERTLHPGNVGSAALVLGGLLVVALPQHVVSLVQLVVVTVASAAILHAVAVHAPDWSAAGAWLSPFHGKARARRPPPANWELDWIRAKLAGRRQRVPDGPPLPPGILHLLRPLIVMGLERQGVEPDHPAYLETARVLTSAPTWAVLASEPLARPRWYGTVRPAEARVAEVVHGVLDDLDRLTPGGDEHQPSLDPRSTRAT